jgi:hypothetical protein
MLSISVGFIYNELHKATLQNVSSEMSAYFAIQTYSTPPPLQSYIYIFLLFMTTIITLTITDHLGSWSHQFFTVTVKNTIIVPSEFTNIFLI